MLQPPFSFWIEQQEQQDVWHPLEPLVVLLVLVP